MEMSFLTRWLIEGWVDVCKQGQLAVSLVVTICTSRTLPTIAHAFRMKQ